MTPEPLTLIAVSGRNSKAATRLFRAAVSYFP